MQTKGETCLMLVKLLLSVFVLAYNTKSVAQPSNNNDSVASVTGVIIAALPVEEEEEEEDDDDEMVPVAADGAAVPVPAKFLSPLTTVVDWTSMTVKLGVITICYTMRGG